MGSDDDNNQQQSNGSDGEPDGDIHREPDLSLDAMLELLAQRERRHILSYLKATSEGVATVDELIEHIVQLEVERTGEVPNRDHIHTSLYHLHLPKLADADVVEYDARNQQLHYTGNDRFDEWVERIMGADRESNGE